MAELTYRDAVAYGIAQEMRRDPSLVMLGEDIAGQGEILLTESAYRALGDSDAWQFEDASVSISGLDLTSYKLVR